MVSLVRIILGAALVALAVIPTPDDLTIVSPIAQASLGLATIATGLEDKKHGD